MRTSINAVKAVFRSTVEGTDYDGTTDLTPFIETASSIVDDVATCATLKGRPLTDTKLELIERWLSAWAYCMSDRPYSSRSTGGASGSFQGQTAMHFDANYYGQMAISLDSSGCLYSMGKGMEVGITHLGKVPSERIPYEHRS